MFTQEDIIEAYKRVRESITDENTAVGVDLLAAEILNVSIDRLYELEEESTL